MKTTTEVLEALRSYVLAQKAEAVRMSIEFDLGGDTKEHDDALEMLEGLEDRVAVLEGTLAWYADARHYVKDGLIKVNGHDEDFRLVLADYGGYARSTLDGTGKGP